MKKSANVIIILLLILSLVGCGTKEVVQDKNDSNV